MRRLYTTTSESLGLRNVIFQWRSDNERFAAAGRKRSVTIYDRNGQSVTQVNLPDSDFEYDEDLGAVQTLVWHQSCTHLAILPRGQTFAMVYDAATGEVARVDGGIKQEEVCFICWSPSRPLLMLGTVRGTCLLYDCASRLLTPLGLRHNKPVCCGAWSSSDVIALGSWDGQLSLCRAAADSRLAKSIALKGRPGDVRFCHSASDGCCLYLSAAVGRKSLLVWEVPLALVSEAVPPNELAFPTERYGELECHSWVGDGLVAAGFSSGQVVVVAVGGGRGGPAAGRGPGAELFSCKLLPQPVAAMAWSPLNEWLAVGVGARVAILHCDSGAGAGAGVQQLHGQGVELEGVQSVAGLEWSPSGDLLTVASCNGRLHQYLVRALLLHATCGSLLAYAVSLAEVVVEDAAAPKRPSATVRLDAEPALLALGPDKLAAARGAQVWLHSLHPDQFGLLPAPLLLEFPTPIQALCLNGRCLVLLGEGGRVFVQPIGGSTGAGGAGELCGEDGRPHQAACVGVTPQHVVVGLPDGTLGFYGSGDLQLASEYQHAAAGIARLFPSPADSRVVFQDAAGGAFLYDAPSEALVPLPEWAADLQLAAVLWDVADPRVLVAASASGLLHVYVHIVASVAGHGVKLVGRQRQPVNLVPLVLRGGRVACQTSSGQLDQLVLDTHRELVEGEQEEAEGGKGLAAEAGTATAKQASAAGSSGGGGATLGLAGRTALLARYQQALALCHFPRALACARRLGDAFLLREVAAAALQFLEVPLAVQAYEAAGDGEAAQQLAPLLGVADPDLLAGQLIPLLGGDVDRAEALLLRSSQPGTALELRQRLGQWGEALRLARRLEPGAVGALSLEQAREAEAAGRAEEAAALYSEALGRADVEADPPVAVECRGALARCAILVGRAEQGVGLALASGDPALLLQCAELLERQRLPAQAAALYERAGSYDAAARLYLRCREFGAADAIAGRVESREVRLLCAQAKEDLGQLSQAAAAYAAAGDLAGAIRVQLERLEDPQAAAQLAGSDPVALRQLAQGCERTERNLLAVRHYCSAADYDRAFDLAKEHGCMAAFTECMRAAAAAVDAGGSSSGVATGSGSGGTAGGSSAGGSAGGSRVACPSAELLRVAAYYETQLDLPQAAELFAEGGQPERAARLLLQAGGASVAAAAALAGRVRDPRVSALVVEHVKAAEGVGPTLLQLHLALGQAEEACAVALARAAKEQAEGNYKAARDELVALCVALQAHQLPATPVALSSLALLHSYLLVKTLVRLGDHAGAARLLLHCAEQVSAFPRHTVPILTSTVIECHRAGLHLAAQRWAAVLVRPEHAGQVGEAYRRKVEALAKRPDRGEADPPEAQCECLFCGAPGPETALGCASCHAALPFCLASGKRVALADWSECPACRLPCRGTELARVVAAGEGRCPLCEAEVAVHAVRRIWDPIAHLRRTAFASLVPSSPRRG